MDRGVKIAAACSVLLCGLVVALLLRHESPQTRPPVPGSGDRLVLRKGGPSPGSHTGGRWRPELVDAATPQRPNIVTPTNHTDWPVLAKIYPHSISLSLPAAPRAGEPVRTHKIVDGDTLETLAERYLGSAEHWVEIYEANRDVLSSPQILPIAVKLKIPPRRRGGSTTAAGKDVPAASNAPHDSDVMPKRPLVPISGYRR